MLPTATNSVIGAVPQGHSGMGSASNTVALQVGGALGVAVIGSVMLTRYQSHMAAALVGRQVPRSVATTIFGSLGAALAVATRVGGSTGAELARAARTAFMSGTQVALGVGAIVALAASFLVLVALPSQPSAEQSSPADPRAGSPPGISDIESVREPCLRPPIAGVEGRQEIPGQVARVSSRDGHIPKRVAGDRSGGPVSRQDRSSSWG
jgi:hypothetical protein